MPLKIINLHDRPDLVPTLASWFLAEWEPYYGPDGVGDAAADLSERPGADGLPVAFVALGEDGTLLGTAALKADSVGEAPGPWLAAMIVAPEHRGQGIGTALTAAVEDHGRKMGFKAIYCSTDAADGIMRRRGWQAVGDTETLRGTVRLFRKIL